MTNETNKYQLLPANSGIENASLSTQLNEYNTKLLERNSLVAHSSTKNPLVREMDKSLDAMRNALISSIDNQWWLCVRNQKFGGYWRQGNLADRLQPEAVQILA